MFATAAYGCVARDICVSVSEILSIKTGDKTKLFTLNKTKFVRNMKNSLQNVTCPFDKMNVVRNLQS